ncbi:ribonuclease PH [Aetokthonos hydrillicola Thurmond2011]|jgi:ribonuclease PH|uniref:Ribonuclease PH n=1 Tax=Aetokthonos hydrillicola Thurmond2011 TaxID=2712845 RepID=A0AAP5IDS2_9CYAN|nr:ribonuclease PH [Aetokthonos hydrillicola]MBO3461615.1 ribonuclease PH [Aetokthonos hydrillicola CCALA 1050]MBW4589316.1 ribonuclease PH [Aetokthonos hydrillicola CCALA 1050]MDR9898152.1 ribonuclease PH [Aetokthonos hydrillicola Thurmond2011]
MIWQRSDGRQPEELRPISFQQGFTNFAPGSVLAKCGNTQVLCTVSVTQRVPTFLQGTGKGWLTAEYRMLPSATQQRQERELLKLSGRTQEIQRLIGRSLRAAIDLEILGEYTLTVDADVLQADAGTRTTAITGGFVALANAISKLLQEGVLTRSPLIGQIAAISVGLLEGEAYLDLDYVEDVAATVDLNVVMNQDFGIIEIQGTAEEGSFTRTQLNRLLDCAEKGIEQLLLAQREALPEIF